MITDSPINHLQLQPLDIGLTRSPGLFGRLIRLASTSPGEPPTEANHVWVCSSGGSVGSNPRAEIEESLWRVVTGPCNYQPSDIVAIYRPLGLTAEQVVSITRILIIYTGSSYGYLKLPLHALDWMLCNGRTVFRTLAKSWEHQECSGLIARAWSYAGLHFGVEPYAAQPDDIHDYCSSHPHKYALIWPVTHPSEATHA